MANDKIDPSLLYLEVPIYSNDTKSLRCQDIIVNEGEADPKFAEGCSYADGGGGVDIFLKDVKRTVFWKTHGNVLDLFELSLHVNLVQNHFQIVFQNSKVLPGVVISHSNNQLIILCATLHGVHRIVLNTVQFRKERSVLSGLSSSSFTDANHNFYFTQVDKVACFTAGVFEAARKSSVAMFAFAFSVGNIALVKMPSRGQVVLDRMNQPSRMSRIWSGINPWAGSGGGETPCDLTMINSKKPKVVAVCRDYKIRMWSCKNQECIAQLDLCQYLQEEDHENEPENHKIRSAINEEIGTYTISVYLSFGGDSQFLNFRFKDEANQLDLISNVQCRNDTATLLSGLVDFQVSPSNQLWALWMDAEEETSLAVCNMNSEAWHDVALSLPPPQEISVPSDATVEGTYLHHIFVSGNFSSVAITKALSIHRRAVVSSRNMSWRLLRENVMKLVQNEVEAMLPEDESVSDADVMEAQLSAWQAFYQTCIQYQQFVTKPIGITTPRHGGICLVKKEHISHLVPVSNLEAVCRGASPDICKTILPDEPSLDDLGKLVKCLSLLSNILGLDYVESLLQTLPLHESPIEAVQASLDNIRVVISERSNHFELEESLAAIGDMVSTINMLMMCLDPGNIDQDLVTDESAELDGDCEIEILCRVLQRYVNDRLQLSLLLLIMSILFELQNTLPSRVSIYVQAYSAIKWAVTAETENVSQASLEKTLQTLSVRDAPQSHGHPTLLIDYYLRNDGGKLLRGMLGIDGAMDNDMMPQAAASVVQLLWPLGPTMSFPEFLLTQSQFSHLQHYLKEELSPWCDFCPACTTYMLGHCQLNDGLHDQAVKTFLEGGDKVNGEEIHFIKLLQIDEHVHPDQMKILYYTKILQIFEERDLGEQLIEIAKHAIGKANIKDPSLPILCSSVFRQTLRLHRHNEAYKAIIWNPDPEHRKDCLRAFVVALCERKEYNTLVEYPYDEMHDDLVQILEHRARCSDIMTSPHKYYDLLYAFHVYRSNHRRAASTMYEQSWRIESEPKSLEAFKHKRTCLVSTVTSLMLVDPAYQWVVHPNSTLGANQEDGGKSPKRDHDGDEVEYTRGNREVVICELSDIQNEIILVEARLKMFAQTKNDSAIAASVSAKETVTLLSHAGMYGDAFSICVKFKLPLTGVFESVATRCIQSSYSSDDIQISLWLSGHDNIVADDGRSSMSDMAWRLLEKFLEKYGSASGCHKTVLTTLLGYSCVLPAWFVIKYKKHDAPELIRWLICYDYLEQATVISMEYIDAVMGVGPEHFKIKESDTLLHPPCRVWLPYNEIEQLLKLLQENNAPTKCKRLHMQLSQKMKDYHEETKKVSSMMWQLAK